MKYVRAIQILKKKKKNQTYLKQVGLHWKQNECCARFDHLFQKMFFFAGGRFASFIHNATSQYQPRIAVVARQKIQRNNLHVIMVTSISI